MSIPTHRADCQTWLYPTRCWSCNAHIHVLQCTCGSAVLFDETWPDWEHHECGRNRGIGGSGISGWEAVDVLRSYGLPIDARVFDKVFPPGKSSAPKQNEVGIESVQPASDGTRVILAVLREFNQSTKRTKELEKLGALGRKLLGLPNRGRLWQLTLIVNNERPNKSYTCICPDAFEIGIRNKDQVVLATIEPRKGGSHAIWLVKDIRPL